MLTTTDDTQAYIKLNSLTVGPIETAVNPPAVLEYTATIEGVQEHGFLSFTLDPLGEDGLDLVTAIESARTSHVI